MSHNTTSSVKPPSLTDTLPPAALAFLSAAHTKLLTVDSAITPALVQARGYRTLDHPDEIAALGFSKPQARTAPALALPLWDVHGEQYLCQIRPDAPRTCKDKGTDKPAKYECPRGAKVRLDVHPACQAALGDPSLPLWLTEGVRKGDALLAAGAGCVIAFPTGVWGWKGTNEHNGKVILPCWQHVALNGRTVYVAFDSDLATKKGVQDALDGLWTFLRSKAALPSRVHWPDAYTTRKWGVDDFFASGKTLADLQAMIPPIGLLPATAPRHLNGTTAHHAPGTVPEEQYPYSDAYNALALVQAHGQDMRYCPAWKSWLVWTGTHWQRDTSGLVLRWQRHTVMGFGTHLLELGEAKAKALLDHIKSSLNTARLKAAVEQAQSWEGLSIDPGELDTNPWLLNCTNGTLDLHTGELRAHQPTDLITKCLAILYTPDAACSAWDAFQWRIMGGTRADPETEEDLGAGEIENRQRVDERAKRLIRFKQRFAGYALTGDTREQCLCVYHGKGANGKSTELETLKALFADYAQSTPSASLLAKDRHDGIQNDIARLRGARLVTAVEIGEGKRLDEELVKRLTGQDTLTARFLHAEFFDFKAEFKLIIACNHLPNIKGTDHAIWRRLHCIPFTVTIPEEEQDKGLAEKLRAELPGILRWAVQGALAWQKEGLGIPDEVRTATKDYRASQDVLGRFVEECCLVNTSVRVKTSEIYMAYKKWCETSGEYALSLTAFGIRLEEQGFERHVSGGSWRLGIGLMTTTGG